MTAEGHQNGYRRRMAGPAVINSKNICQNDLEIIGLNSRIKRKSISKRF
jgi:hypothetical protein